MAGSVHGIDSGSRYGIRYAFPGLSASWSFPPSERHLPPADQKYKVIKNIKIGKGSYGSVQDILPKMAEYAQLRGADAIVEYNGSQRFGFWPWRMVRPVVRGVAVQWTDPKPSSCESIGGTRLRTILSSGQPPAQ
ncbi:hypothetical protein [Paraburkholderia caribensis]|uniref:hypothetical protein n=1 Tax=Paraburkholderia caribensis TaxID=75105 RepID=UPI001F3B589B|nr:hypothetical protein [Paraburkholderia caribensis]